VRYPRVNTMSLAAVVVVAGFITGCNGKPKELICPFLVVPGASVFVKDSVTGNFIASGATLTARDSTVRYQALSFDRSRPDKDAEAMKVLANIVGRWTLTLTKPGYAPWTREVITTVDECGIGTKTTTFTALLQPIP
jgi:hypothetical protein